MSRNPTRRAAAPAAVLQLALFACALVSARRAPAEHVLEEFSVAHGGDFIVVPIAVEQERYQFVLDTGSTCSYFNQRHSKMLGAPIRTVKGRVPGGTRRLEQFAAPRMSLGSIALQTDNEVLCDDLSKAEMVIGRAIDGILGMDALRHLVVRIDFDEAKVRILKSAEGAPGRPVPMIWRQRRSMREGPFVLVTIDGVPHEFLLDSGSIWQTIGTMDVEPFDTHVALGSIVPIRSLYTSESTGSSNTLLFGRARTIEVAGFKHENAILGRNAFWNAFGIRFLARYVVTCDFPNSIAYLKPGKDFDVPDRLDTSGVFTNRRENDLVVANVTLGAPGQLAGLRRGDVILRIDGEATTGWSLFRVHLVFAVPGTHALIVRRGDDEHELRLLIHEERKADSKAKE